MDSSKPSTTRAAVDGGLPVAGVGSSVHDLLSLGFIQEALQLSAGKGTGTSAATAGGRRLTDDESRRLPLLLRL